MKQAILSKKPVIVVDDRERDDFDILLRSKGVLVIRKRIEVGDFIVGDVGIERKSANDFLNSIVDGRIFEQARNLKENYEKAIVIIEGDIWGEIERRNINENAVRGVFLSLALDYKIGILYSRDIYDTVEYLYLLSKREGKNYIKIGRKKSVDPRLQILVGFPGIGPKLAKKLLDRYGSLEKIFSLSYPELKKVLGEERAKKFLEVLRGWVKIT